MRSPFSLFIGTAVAVVLLATLSLSTDDAEAGREPQCISLGYDFASGFYYQPFVPPQLTLVRAEGCPGPVASVAFVSRLDSLACGSSINLNVEVVDGNEYYVKDGTQLTFSTSLGSITPEKTTRGGLATVSLLLPAKTSGTVELTVLAGSVAATKTIPLTCS